MPVAYTTGNSSRGEQGVELIMFRKSDDLITHCLNRIGAHSRRFCSPCGSLTFTSSMLAQASCFSAMKSRSAQSRSLSTA